MISDTLALAWSRYHNVRVNVPSRGDFAFESFDCGASTCRYPEKQEAESTGTGRNSTVIMITVSPALSIGSFLRPRTPDRPLNHVV